MEDWCKLRVDFRRHLKIFNAGPDAALLFIGLMCINQERGASGAIAAEHSSPSALAFNCPAFGFNPERVETALEKLLESGLVERCCDGSLSLTGYDDEFMPRCSKCESPNPEPRYRTCPACRQEARNYMKRRRYDRAKDVAGKLRDVAPQRRSEEIRSESDQRGGEEIRSEGAEPPALDPNSGDIGLILRRAKWGNGDFHRAREAMRLDRQGWTGKDISMVWDVAVRNGGDPTKYFASIIRSHDKIHEIANRHLKRGG